MLMNTIPKISIIIPVYNVEEYLRECLDSVLNQDFTDIELVCIDDCSTDGSLAILLDYKEKDKRIIVVENRNNIGLGATRNVGIDIAQGEYLYFLDSDDYLYSSDALRKMHLVAEKNDLEMLCFSSKTIVEDDSLIGKNFDANKKHMYPSIMSGIDSFVELVDHNEYRSPVWTYLYSRRFIVDNRILFFTDMAHEDLSFSFRAHLNAKRVRIISDVLHCYRIRSNSITNSEKKFYRLSSMEKSIGALFDSLCDGWYEDYKVSKAYEYELQIELGVWEKGFLNCDFREKKEYLKQKKNPLIERIFRNEILSKHEWEFTEEIINKLKNSVVWLYGAGNYAKLYINALKNVEVEIAGLLVTNENDSKIFGFEPVEYSKWKTTNNALIVLAVSEKYKGEVIRNIRRWHDVEYIDLSPYFLGNLQ